MLLLKSDVSCFYDLIWDLMFLFNVQVTVFLFLQISVFLQENILYLIIMGYFIWLCCVDLLYEDLSLCFRHVLNYLIFMFYWSCFLLGTQITPTLGLPLFSFFSYISIVFSLFYLSSCFLFYWVLHSSKFHRDLLMFSLFIDCIFISWSVTNLHLIFLPFCLWGYLLLQNSFLCFFQIMYIFLV